MGVLANKNLVLSSNIEITTKEFQEFQKLIYDRAGISLNETKKTLVMSRLGKRLRYLKLTTYTDYLCYIHKPENYHELQTVTDLLTTNETYFFREPKHFDFLKSVVFPKLENSARVKIWSAASSSGEEAYTLAMLLDEKFTQNRWEVLGTDISNTVLETARKGLYPMSRCEKTPAHYLNRYCLKGVRSQEGYVMIDKKLRKNVTFKSMNLNETLPETGLFDVIFLRNVLIYFNAETKRNVVERLVARLNSNGYFFVSHSETLNGITSKLKNIQPSIYIKP